LNIEQAERRTSNVQRPTSNDEIARAAQALAPRVTLPVCKKEIEQLIKIFVASIKTAAKKIK